MTLEALIAYPILTLAAFRFWRMVAVDTITEPIRARLLFREGRVWEWFADLVTCPWCLGFWISGGAAGWAVVFGVVSPVGGLPLWFAVSAGVGIIATAVDRLSSNG